MTLIPAAAHRAKKGVHTYEDALYFLPRAYEDRRRLTKIAEALPGQPATIRVEAYPDRTFQGTIAFIAPELDPSTRTVAVTVRPDNTPDNGQGLLRPGMSATVEFGGQ